MRTHTPITVRTRLSLAALATAVSLLLAGGTGMPFRYEQALWAMVFPLGMYAAASDAFGEVAGLGALVTIARVEVWFALAAWAVTTAVMIRAALYRVRGEGRRPSPPLRISSE
jgi:tellurite resistance protein TehA-like permease